MEETNQGTPQCPNTVTIRRNPHRKARPTLSSAATSSRRLPLPCPLSSPSSDKAPSPSATCRTIPPFPTGDLLSIQLPETQNNLKVFLRIRPPITTQNKPRALPKNAWPRKPSPKSGANAKSNKKKSSEICVSINDSHSVTLCPPKAQQEAKRVKSEIYEGFSHVFSPQSPQGEVFEKMVKPLVDEFLRGRSGMLAALGPTGSGKTHTVFGSAREPGMVPLALRQIFSRSGIDHGKDNSQASRTFYLSMFEICSERGKAERLGDLLQDGGELFLQQSTVKGLHEVLISNVQQAESLIARGLLKRATAMTNSNSQSSRSQCVINIRNIENKVEKEADVQLSCAVLTIVDLAGAEREKKTGNQGARLLESNFINNTSMVFGLCLRSLLEHQKHPKKALQKHFLNSMLTRYLREFLDGRKRMALILTMKSGEEDYLDSSFLLRQASPYMKIKFDNVEEPATLVCTKRPSHTLLRTEQLKRMRSSSEECVNSRGKGAGDQLHEEEGKKAKEIASQNPINHATKTVHSDLGMMNECVSFEESSSRCAKEERNNIIMQNFAKALWNVLKQYKKKLEVAEKQNQNLSEILTAEKARRSELEIELDHLKGCLSCGEETSPIRAGCQPIDDASDLFSVNISAEQDGCQPLGDVDDSDIFTISCSLVNTFEGQGQGYEVPCKECGGFPESLDCECLTKIEDTWKDDIHFNASGNQQSVMTSPKPFSIDTESSCHSIEEKQQYYEEQSHQPELRFSCKPLKQEKPKSLVEDESYWETSAAKVCFSASSSIEENGHQPIDDAQDSNLYNASSSVDIAARQQGYEECGGFPGIADGESFTDPINTRKNDIHVNDSGHQQPLVSSPKPLTIMEEKNCESTKKNQIHGEGKKQLHPSIKPKEQEVRPDCNIENALKSESKLQSACKPLNGEKPKRRLVPASSILLKHVGSLGFEDEDEKPKGTKGDKKWGAPSNDKNRTQGSMSLLRLLQSNLHL